MPIALKTESHTRRFSLGLGPGVFFIVLALRLSALLRLTHSALLIPSQGDMHFYNDWARQILHGQLTQHLAFYGLPGYAYLVAILGRVFGENPFIPGLLQSVMDAGTAFFVYQIFFAVFGSASSNLATGMRVRIAAALAALGWGFFVPAEAYAIVLMPTAWFVFVFWLVVWRLVHTDTGPSITECFFLALLIGITATAVATIISVA